MSQYVDTPTKAFTANAAIGEGILVKKASGKVAIAGLAEQPIGVTVTESFADGDTVTVRLLSATGTIKMSAAGAVAEGAVVYGRAAGQVDDVATSSAVKVGVALEAATAQNDLIEVMPIA